MNKLIFLIICFIFCFKSHAFSCPDPSYTMVVSNAINVQTATKTANDVAKWGEKAGFKVKRLFLSNHTRSNLLNYMNCKNIRVFFNISHSLFDTIKNYNDNEQTTANDIRSHVSDNKNTWLCTRVLFHNLDSQYLRMRSTTLYL